VTASVRDVLLGAVPVELVDGLLRQHSRAHRSAQLGRWEDALEAVGKYTEFAWRCNQQVTLGRFTSLEEEMPKTHVMLREIEQQRRGSCPESLRVTTPKVLYALYALRSKRGGAHVSGEVNSDRVDTMLSLRMADWFLAELVRVLEKLPLEEAQALVDSLVQREMPVVYRDEHVRRVMKTGLKLGDEILVLLCSETVGLTEKQLIESSQKSRGGVRSAIDNLVRQRLAYRTKEQPYRLRILPTGEREVEQRALLEYPADA